MKAKEKLVWTVAIMTICAALLAAAEQPKEKFDPTGDESSRRSLAGLEGAQVVIKYAEPKANNRDRNLQTMVEEQLRECGLTVFNSGRRVAAPGSPYLYIEIDDRRTAASVAVKLMQKVRLERDPAISCYGATWERTSLVTGGEKNLKRMIRKHVMKAVDKFCSDYLTANPKVLPMITGTIRHLSFEGGFYGIVADNGQKYDPMNLPKEFKQNGLRVKFQVKEKKRMAGIHMWGKIVEIIKIEKL